MPLPSPTIEPAPAVLRRARPLLGTLVDIAVGGQSDPDCVHAAMDRAFGAVDAIQSLLSCHDAGSELSRLNRNAHRCAQRVSAHTFRVFEAALGFAAASNGAFDPCIAPRLEAWGYLPAHDRLQYRPGQWREIELIEGGGIRYHRPLRVDLGGIAKGYAVDQAVLALRDAGMDHILVNAGGDLRTFGLVPWPVQVRHPQSPLRHGYAVEVQNAALATSAAYFSTRLCRGTAVSELVDPRTGAPYVQQRSVSVLAPDCMTADALTKIVLFGSDGDAYSLLARYAARAYVVEPAGTIAA